MAKHTDDMKTLFGPVRRWKEDGVLFAENDWIKAAYFVTSDPEKVGALGFEGPNEICVEYISPVTGMLWETETLTMTDRDLEKINAERRRKGLSPLTQRDVSRALTDRGVSDSGSFDTTNFLISYVTGIPTASPAGILGASLHPTSPAYSAPDPSPSFTSTPDSGGSSFDSGSSGGSFDGGGGSF